MRLEIFDTVTSTMDVARANVLSGKAQEYAGVLAREQTAGRGQRGRVWFAAPGESLSVTYYFPQTQAEVSHAGELAPLAAVALADVIRAQAFARDGGKKANARVGVKWPNDVLLNRKKVAGILIEMVCVPQGDWMALVGVGMNVTVRSFPPEIERTATSLILEGAAEIDVEALAKQIARALQTQLDLRAQAGFATVLERWRKLDQTPGRRFETIWEGDGVCGVAVGVDEKGALRLKLDDGRTVTVGAASSLREL